MVSGVRLSCALSIALLLSGCGGSAATEAPAAGSSEASVAPEAPTPTQAALGTVPPSEPPASASAPPPVAGGGGAAEDVCVLATADELGGVLGLPVTTVLLQGPPDTCDVQSDGAPVAALTLTLPNAQLGLDPAIVYQAMSLADTVTPVDGIGDKAVFDNPGETLIILKGDKLLVVAAFPPGASLDQRKEMMRRIGTIAAGRM